MDARWHVLRVLDVPLVLPGHVLHVGSQGALESFRAAEGETLLLVSPAWSHLDGRPKEEAWTPGLGGVRALRPGRRDGLPLAGLLCLREGIVPPSPA